MRHVGEKVEPGHLRDYWRVVWNGRWTVLSIFAVVVVTGTVLTLLQKPVYDAAASLEINARPRGVVPGADGVAQLGASEYGYLAEERYYNTQYQILRSRSLARDVIESLGLEQHPAFAAVADMEAAFIQRVIISPVPETGVVNVHVRAGDPQEAALWVNTLTSKFVERNLSRAIANTEGAVNALIQRLQPLRAQLSQNETDRLEFAGDQNLLVSDDPQRNLQERLKALQADLTKAQVRRLELQGLYEAMQEIERNDSDYLVLPQVSADETIRELVGDRIKIETELRRLLVTFKPGHFKVREKESELEKLDQKIDGEVQRIVGAVRAEYALLKAREAEFNSAILETQRQSVDLGRRASEYEVFRSEATETRRIYDLISTRIKEIQLNANLLRNNVAIIDAAVVPTSPISPRRRLNVALSVVVGLLLGLGVVFFLDYLDATVKTSEDVENFLGLSILAVIPRKDSANERVIKESFQSLRTNLHFSSLNRSRRIILVTSTGPQEGKTSTTVALARTLAASGDRVALIDCDLRRPNIHNHLNVKRNFGLTNYLADGSAEEGSWQKYLKTVETQNLHVLTCGPIPPNPPELFGTKRFRALLDELKEGYDWVLLDSPPVASLTDSVILASLADLVMFVIRHRGSDRELVRRSVESLRSVNEHISGAVLNDVNLDRSHYRDYYYSGQYYYGNATEEGKGPASSLRRKVG